MGLSSSVVTPGITATAFATTPAVHYHFDSQAVSVDTSNRLTNCPDLQSLAEPAAILGNNAPRLITDALGRNFLRFNGSEAAAIGNDLVVASNRSFMVLMVGRVHHQCGTVAMMAPRFANNFSPTANTGAGPINYLQGTSRAMADVSWRHSTRWQPTMRPTATRSFPAARCRSWRWPRA